MTKTIHVVINPGSGQPQPVLHTLNQVFRKAKVDWDISLTKRSGDAERLARQAAEAGADVVAAFGGDGTVMEVGRGLIGSQASLAILPGGTANLMSLELGIPKELELAAAIAASARSQTRMVDMGKIGDTYFLLRVGLGFAAAKVKVADRQLKDKYGKMAYTIGALKAMKQAKTAYYKLNLDGSEIEAEGVTCLVDNAGNLGTAGISAARTIDVSDGLLDVILVRNAGFSSMFSMGTSLVASSPVDRDSFHHWQARNITILADPAQPVQVDGEMAGQSPVTISVVPQVIRVLVPG